MFPVAVLVSLAMRAAGKNSKSPVSLSTVTHILFIFVFVDVKNQLVKMIIGKLRNT